MYKLDLEKAEESEIKLPTYRGWSKKQEFQKSIYFCFIDYAKALTVWITANSGKFFKRWEYRLSDLTPEKSDAGQEATVRTGHVLHVLQRTGS